MGYPEIKDADEPSHDSNLDTHMYDYKSLRRSLSSVVLVMASSI